MNSPKTIIGWALVLVLAYFLLKSLNVVNNYTTITTSLGNASPSNFFGSKQDIQCVPGPGPQADYYTGEDGGGLCKGQEFVHKMGHQYSIDTGIGGSLLCD